MSELLPPPSIEQLRVINSVICDDRNVKLTSVAGSGKTTLSLHCIHRMQSTTSSHPDFVDSPKRILLLTYNSNLKRETRKRITKMGLNFVEVHSFHSFGKHYYHDSCRTDEALDMMVSSFRSKIINVASLLKDVSFDFLIVDECQDVCPLYWNVILLIAEANNRGVPQFMLIGDPRQSIYEYKGADPRYLTHCEQLMPPYISSHRKWVSHTLNTTWRLTNANATFVNSVFLKGENVLISGSTERDDKTINKVSSFPTFLICNTFKHVPAILVFKLLKQFRPEQIMILAPSVKRGAKTPLRQLEKILLEHNVPINVNDAFEDSSSSEEIMQGKLAFMTFHGSKGSERDAVIVFGGTDENYQKFFHHSVADHTECPNTIYVSMTRARKTLVVIHHDSNALAPYIDRVKLYDSCSVEGSFVIKDVGTCIDNMISNNSTKRHKSVLDVLSHISFDKVKELVALLSVTKTTLCPNEFPHPDLPTKVRTKWGCSIERSRFEYVADINGIAIPSMLEYRLTGSTWLFETLNTLKNIDTSDFCCDMRAKVLARVKSKTICVSDFLVAAILQQSSKSHYFYRAKQINNYKWLAKNHVEFALAIIGACGVTKSSHPMFEVPLGPKIMTSTIKDSISTMLIGCADVVTDDYIFELKCTSDGETQMIHLLQLALYGWLHGDSSKQLRLVYIASGTIIDLKNDQCAFDKIIESLQSYH